MVKCMNFRFGSEACDHENFTTCAKEVSCQEEEEECFTVWYVENNVSVAMSAGCNPFFGRHIPPELCPEQCVGQPKGSVIERNAPKYYCCCRGDNCNADFVVPPPQSDSITRNSTRNLVLFQPSHESFGQCLVPFLVFSSILLALFYIYRLCGRNRDTVFPEEMDLELGALALPMDERPRPSPTEEVIHQSYLNGSRQPKLPFPQPVPQQVQYSSPESSLTPVRTSESSQEPIKLDEIELLEELGRGRFAVVHRAKAGNDIVAVKVTPSDEYDSWQNECRIYTSRDIKHPNILRYIHSGRKPSTDSFWLVVEYAPKGSLYDYLQNNTVSWNELIKISLGIALGLTHLHDKSSIAHRDFKSKNVLLGDNLSPLITDFGVASILDTDPGSHMDHRSKFSQVGTPRYMSPEVLGCMVTFTKACFAKIDVYALSLVFWEILSRCNEIPIQKQPTPSESEPELSGTLENYQVEEYKSPFEGEVGPNPDILKMKEVVIRDGKRPHIRPEWSSYPVRDYVRTMVDGWAEEIDSRVSAACFSERLKRLPIFRVTTNSEPCD